jgi:hypothetical protein
MVLRSSLAHPITSINERVVCIPVVVGVRELSRTANGARVVAGGPSMPACPASATTKIVAQHGGSGGRGGLTWMSCVFRPAGTSTGGRARISRRRRRAARTAAEARRPSASRALSSELGLTCRTRRRSRQATSGDAPNSAGGLLSADGRRGARAALARRCGPRLCGAALRRARQNNVGPRLRSRAPSLVRHAAATLSLRTAANVGRRAQLRGQPPGGALGAPIYRQ